MVRHSSLFLYHKYLQIDSSLCLILELNPCTIMKIVASSETECLYHVDIVDQRHCHVAARRDSLEILSFAHYRSETLSSSSSHLVHKHHILCALPIKYIVLQTLTGCVQASKHHHIGRRLLMLWCNDRIIRVLCNLLCRITYTVLNHLNSQKWVCV